MSFWQILGNFAFSDSGETVHKISDSLSISTEGTSYTTMGLTTVGSDGSVFIQQGVFSSDGSTRMGSVATGLGAGSFLPCPRCSAISASRARSTNRLVSCLRSPFSPMRSSGFL